MFCPLHSVCLSCVSLWVVGEWRGLSIAQRVAIIGEVSKTGVSLWVEGEWCVLSIAMRVAIIGGGLKDRCESRGMFQSGRIHRSACIYPGVMCWMTSLCLIKTSGF